MNDLPELARKVQIAAEAISSGQVSDNLELLRAIRNLNRVVESPVERVRRIVYQVSLIFDFYFS